MKPSTPLFSVLNLNTSFFLTCLLTLLLGFVSVDAFGQAPCDDCNSGSCDFNPSPVANPDVQDPCSGFDIVLVLDESWSISQINGGADAVEDAVLNFLGSVSCGDLKVRVLKFKTEAEWMTNNYQDFPSAYSTMQNLFNGGAYDPSDEIGYTNWHSALSAINALNDKPELVLFWTDGLPTAMNGAFTSNGSVETCNSSGTDSGPNRNAIYVANSLRNGGTHIFGVGIGGSLTGSGLSNLQAITGTEEYTSFNSVLTADYASTTFANISEDMQQLAFSLCPSVSCESLNVCPMDANSGSIEITMNVGGNTYDWTFTGPNTNLSGTGDDDPTKTFQNLPAGNFVFSLTDVGGCEVETSCNIEIADPLTCDITVNNHIDCNNTTGSVTIQGSGGSGVYRYSTSPNSGFSTTNEFNNLSAGQHTFYVMDMHGEDEGCVSECTVEILEDTDPPVCSTGGPYDLNCSNDFSVTLDGNSTTSGMNYQWSFEGQDITTDANGDATVSDPGLYILEVTGPNGCVSQCSVTVTQPEPLDLTCSSNKAGNTLDCFGDEDGMVSVNVEGGTEYFTYEWVNVSNPGQILGTQSSLSGLGAGTYQVTVTDDNGCIETCSITLSQPPLLTCQITETQNVGCDNASGIISISGNGGTGSYEYKLGDGEYQSGNTFTDLSAGTYTVTVKDENGCTSTCMITLDPLSPPQVNIDKEVELEPYLTGNAPNEYGIIYHIRVYNTSADCPGIYDLSDTLKYGAGAVINNVTASYFDGDGQTGTSNYNSFNGQNDFLVTNDEEVGAGEEDIFEIEVIFTVEPEEVTSSSADCNLSTGELGTGLLNKAVISDGVPIKEDEDCEEIPDPSVDITKTVTNGPTPTANLNEYTITYEIEVTNTSNAVAFYDLSDTLKYGAGAIIGDVTASYVSGDGFDGTDLTGSFDGQSNFVISDDEQVGSGQTDVFQVVVTFTVDLEVVTDASADCTLETGEVGTGLLNVAEVSDGVPSKSDDDCAEIPNPSVAIVKMVTSGPTPTANLNEYTITYEIEVTNTSDDLATYDLSDTLKYGAGAIIGDVTAAYVAGGDGLIATINQNFDGQSGNYQIVDNETVAGGATDTYTVTVTFTVDLEVVTDASADCDLTSGEVGTGLLNVAEVSDGVPSDNSEDCEEIPNPSVAIVKMVTSGPTPTANVNEYTITYEIEVTNTSDDLATYDLSDTLKYGKGAIIGDVTAAYVAGGDGLTATINQNFDGQTGNYQIVDNETVSGGATDTYTVTVTFTVDLEAVTDASADCELTTGEVGTGLLNVAEVSGGVPSDNSEDCEEIPNPSVDITKTVTSGPTPTANLNEYTITYEIEVTNTSDDLATYDLSDTLKYGTGAIIGDVTAAYVAGGDGLSATINQNFDGQTGNYQIVDNETVAGGATDTYTVTVTFTVDLEAVTDASADCELTTGEVGTGLLNVAEVSDGVPSDSAEDCEEIPNPSVDITKTVTSGPTPTANVNEYTIIYEIEVTNTSDDLATYDLSDTLKYGAGAIIGEVTAAYVAGGDGLTATINQNFDGQTGNYQIVDNETVAGGATDTYTVTVTFTVDLEVVTDASADCELTTGEVGTGLLNVAEVSDGVPSKSDNDCEEIPNPSVAIVKMVTSGPTPTANVNEYTIIYEIEVTNTSDDLATYDLSDTLKYGAGAIIGEVTASYVSGDGFDGTDLTGSFDGQSNFVISNDEQVGSGQTDVFQVEVTFTVDLEVVTDASADCELTTGEVGTGLLNVAEVSDGVPSDSAEDCEEIPNPSVAIVKMVTSGPTPTANLNEYTITYEIEVTNTSDDLATYDLSDTLKYGAGAIIGDVTASYVSGDGFDGTDLTGSFDGQSNFVISNDEQVGAGQTDVFQVEVTFTVDLEVVTDASADCELTTGEVGTGLLNVAEVSDGVPSKSDDDCEEIPNPSVDITKTVTSGPTPTANVNEYTITYEIEVSNTSDDLATYDLSDTLKYGTGAIIGVVTAAYVAGGDGLTATINQNFDGQAGNYQIVDNETVAGGATDTYTVTVTFSVDLEVVTDASADCELTTGEVGTGLLNVAEVSDGVPSDSAEDCEKIPNPSVAIVKMVTSGPTPTANVNEYTIIYEIEVSNTSDDLATYDLSDTLKYGTGAIIGDVTAAYVAGGDGLTATINQNFDGQAGNYQIVDNETVAGGATDTYTVTVTFTVDLEVVTDASADCELTTGEVGTGLLNVAEVSDGVPSKSDDDCEEIPNPSVAIVKMVTSGPTPTANVNEYTITYEIEVTNTSDDLATYDLSDTLKYGAGAIIGDVTAAYVAGGDGLTAIINQNFDGQAGNYQIVDNETVAGGATDTYTVTVTFTVDLEVVTDASADCELTTGEVGTGLLNVAEVSDGVPSDSAEDCEEIPNPSVDITKTVTSGPTPTANVNEYTITYEIEVTNTSDDLATYDLSDTLKYGTGAIIGDVTAAYVAGGDGLTATINQNFDGQTGNYQIVDNETVSGGATDTYTVTVTFTVDLEAVTDESADCELTTGEVGTGLLNVAEVSGGVPSDKSEDCEEIPNPSVDITKMVTSGPTPTANVNEYTITYEIEVTNTSDDLATYDLSDTLKYGAGAIIGDVTASYVSGDGFDGTDLTGSFDGQSNFVISNDEQVGAGQEDVFQVEVTFTVDLEVVTDASADCELTSGEVGTGLLNVAEVSGGVPSDNSEDCEEIPNPSVDITKTVTSGPTPTANVNEYAITYEIEVTNTSDDLATYDLSDTLKYGAGAIIGDVTAAYVAGGDGLTATINQNFDGQAGNYQIVDNETVAGGATDTYTVTVTFTVDLEVVTDASADCELTTGEVGTGLLNVAEVSDGVPSDNSEDCEEIPNPSVAIVKMVTSGPIPTANVNEYTITYEIEVTNTSDDLATYDLSDTLKYGTGAIIGDVTAAYVAGGDGLTATINQNFDGQTGNYQIVDNETVAGGATDTYTVTVTFTVDLEVVTDASADCELTTGEVGTGLLNVAEVSDGVPSKSDDDCEQIPNPSVAIVKMVTSGPTPTANLNEYTITYEIEVTNTSDDLATYDLSDTLKYGAGAIIGDVTAAYVAGGDGLTATINQNFDGQTGNYQIVDNETVAGGATDIYTVTVTFTVDLEVVTDASADCELTTGEVGTGLLNVAEVSDGVPSKSDDDCEEIPNPSVDITKTVTSGPTPTANVNEYTIIYEIEVTNTSDDLATYDLSDTLKYGTGAIIGDVTASYVSGDGFDGTDLTGSFDGQSNFVISNDEQVGAGQTDVFQVEVTFTVDLEVVTDASADCELTTGEVGTGLLNVAEVSDGVPSKSDDDCEEIPNPSVDITKTVTSGPTPTANVNEYTITYEIEVSNTSDDLATYDLSDTLKYGTGAIIGVVTAAYVAGGDGLTATINQNFDGQAGNYQIVDNETVAGGATDTYTVTVTFSVDLEVVTDASADCELTTGEVGTGLLNVAEVSDGVPSDSAEDCEKIPNPSVAIVKMVTSGPTPTANVNEYTIIYEIEVSNTSDDLATYDLSDTLKYGTGAIIGDVTAAYVAGGDGLTATINQNFDGQAGNYQIVDNETVAGGATDTYTVTVTFTVDLEVVTDASADCELTTGEVGTGLLNVAEVSDGVPSKSDDDCEEIPNPSVAIVKMVTSGPTPTANVNEYTITYEIEVTNTSDDLATYDLSDTLKYGAGAIIGDVTAAYVAGGDGLTAIINQNFDGQAGNYQIVDNETVAGGATDTYTVTVTFTVDLEVVTDASADCELTTGEVGTGLLNVAEVSDGVPSDSAEDCEEIPNPSVDITKTVTSGPTPTANVNEYTITYEIEVTNTSDDLATYDLSDTLKYGTGAIIGDVTAAYVAGGDGLSATINQNFDGQIGNYQIVDNETVAGGATDTYSVTVTFTVNPEEVTTNSADCELTSDEQGTGLFNVAEVSDGIPSQQDSTCTYLPLICNTVLVQNVSCNGGIDGSATAGAVGGVLPYTFEWSNGETTATADSLSVGSHTVIVRDAQGNTSMCMVMISEPPAITCSISVTSTESCNVGNDGAIEITASGGTGELQFSLDSITFQPSNVFDGLTAGDYTVYVRDENGCVSKCSVTVNLNPCASVGDYVWNDYNDNGIQDGGESGIDSVIVILTDAISNNDVRRDTTDANGAYLFDPVDPGTYKITFEVKSGYVFAKQGIGGNATDSDADSNTGMTAIFTLGDNEHRLDIDAGMLEPRIELTATPDCIDDAPLMHYEVHRFGIPANEPLTLNWISLANNTILSSQILESDMGTVLWPEAEVDSEGNGIAWPGWDQNPDGSWFTIPTDLRPDVVVEFSINPTVRDTISYPPAEPFCSANPMAEIGDYVWIDANGNGTQDNGESPVPNVLVYLLDVLGARVDSTITDQNGQYSFRKRMGDFSLQFMIPQGQQATTPGDGSNPDFDNDGDEFGLTQAFNVVPGQRRFDLDLGLLCGPIVIVVDPEKEILCSEPIRFDEPEFINMQPGAQVDVSTEYYIGGFADCRHRRIWRVYNACGDLYTASQTIKIINPELPELRPVHPALQGLANGDSVYFECSKPMFFTTDAFEVVDPCTTCPSNYQIKMDDYVVNHSCEDGIAIKEVVCWWYINDDNGNTRRYTIHIFMVDRMPPEFVSVPVNKTISCDEPVQFGQVAVQDACSDYVSLTHRDTFGVSSKGQSTITRIWTATDGCGNSSSASQTLTLDQSGPVFTSVPQDKTVEAGSAVVFDEPVAGSGCGEVTIEQLGDDEVSGNSCEGWVYTRKWTASTENGLFITTSQTITVKPDQEAPQFERMPGNVVLPCGSELPHFDISVSDNVDDRISITTSTDTEGEGCDQVITRTWTATDACGNTTSVSQVITFSALMDISFTYVPGDVNLKLGAELPDDLATASTTCAEGDVSMTVEDVVADSSTCGRTILRHFIASDDCGNRDTAVQTITFGDEKAPVLAHAISNKNINWGDSIEWAVPEFVDPSGIASVEVSDTAVMELCEGYQKRTWIAVDSCGNSVEVSQVITILPDTKGPVFTTSDSVLMLSFVDTIPDFTPEATDNSGSDVTITLEETTNGDDCRETTIKKWTATDACGNSSTLRWEIIRGDVTGPEFVEIPEDYTVMCIEDVVFDPMIAIDDRDGEVEATFMYLHREGDCFSGFTMSGVWTAVDQCGNLTQHMQNIFVMGDTMAPMITSVPEDITLQCGDDIPEQSVEVAENCRVDTVIVQNDYRPVGDTDCSDGTGYLLLRSWIVEDQCGNRDTATQSITVLGEGQTSLIEFVDVPGTKVVTCAEDAQFGEPVAESSCGDVEITWEDFTFGEPCSPEYKMIREWTASDDCGGSATTYQTIIIRQDTVAPVLHLDHPVKFAGCDPSDTTSFDTPQYWDDCAVELISTLDTTILESVEGDSVKVRTWTYADPCGNESSISQTLIFGATDSDEYFRAERDTFELSCAGELDAYAPLVYSCDSVSVVFADVRSDSTCLNQLTIVRTWTATGSAGQADTLVQVFNVHDTLAPVVVLASDTLYMTSLEYATNGAGSNIVSIMDDCGSATSEVLVVHNEADGEVWYEYEVHVADACGNMTIAKFVVIIAEKPPVVYLLYVNRAVVAEVTEGVFPYDYAWSYLKPGQNSWTAAGDHDNILDLKGMGIVQKVRVHVTDAKNQTAQKELDLINVQYAHKNVTLHPNPATDYVEVRTEMEDVHRIELYNVWGQRVKIYEMDQMDERSRIQLDLRDVPQGTYSVRFLNGYSVYTRQLIKIQ